MKLRRSDIAGLTLWSGSIFEAGSITSNGRNAMRRAAAGASCVWTSPQEWLPPLIAWTSVARSTTPTASILTQKRCVIAIFKRTGQVAATVGSISVLPPFARMHPNSKPMRRGVFTASVTPHALRGSSTAVDYSEDTPHLRSPSSVPAVVIVFRRTSKMTAVDQPNSSTPFIAVIGPSKCQRCTGVTSP
jgi:hypothetical protein